MTEKRCGKPENEQRKGAENQRMTETMCGMPENDREKVRKVRDKEDVNRDKDPERQRKRVDSK